MWGAIKKAINSNLNKSLDVLIQEKHSETNSKIDSKSSQVSVDTVKSLVQDGNNLIGSTNNTGGGVGIGSVSAKLNKLLTDWTTTRAGYVDTTISSRASQSSLNTLQGTANTINSNVGALVNGRVVKSVQYGVIAPINTQILNIPHSNVDINKSVIIINGGIGHNLMEGMRVYISARMANCFSLRVGTTDNFYFYGAGGVSWQLIEFY